MEILLANTDDEGELQNIFRASRMDIAGDIEEHVLIKKGHEIRGGGMLVQLDQNEFHLLVFAVKQNERKKGMGSRLLQVLLKQPWTYCRECAGIAGNGYRVTTVARGESAEFYKKNGFVVCDFSKLAYPFCEQCAECPDTSNCNPLAMVYIGHLA